MTLDPIGLGRVVWAISVDLFICYIKIYIVGNPYEFVKVVLAKVA